MIGEANDTVTLYMQFKAAGSQAVVWERRILVGVAFRQTNIRVTDNGALKIVRSTSMTIPDDVVVEGAAFVQASVYQAETDPEARAAMWTLKRGDVLVLGAGPELSAEYTIKQLKAENDTYATIDSIADNTRREMLNHWKVGAV